MIVVKTYCFKLYKAKRNRKLHKVINIAGIIYNHCIALHKRYYRLFKKSLNIYKLQKHLTKLKKIGKFSYFKEVGSQAIQDITQRIDRACKLFFRNLKHKIRTAPPSFKKIRKYKSFTLKQAGWKLLKGNIIEINKQKYKYFKSRDIEGIVKTITIKRDTLGDIYLYFVCETNENKVLARTGKSVGYDFELHPKSWTQNNFWRCSFFMTKYSNEFKVKAIKMVLKGNSISHVAKILNMPDIAPLCRWISHYEHGGIPQLLHKNRKYTPIFKQKVIEYKWLHHLSLNQTAAKFSIPNTGTISTWEKLYHSYGFSGLLAKKRGRPSMKKSKSKNKVNKPKKELSYVEKLEQEVYQLRMENDLLKKWHALMKQWEKEGRH